MIIRKPYAFLIKNFKKIHIFLLILSIYVAYKLIGVSNFVNEFMRLGTYDLFADPITNHITWLTTLSIFLLIIGSTAILFLLNHKKKPWKLYLVPIIEYFALFLVLSMIKSFFNKYTSDVSTTDLRMSRDLLMIFIVLQLPVIGIYAMRVFGLDIKKFNFNVDQEFLELSEEDREEIEIGINVDKESFLRGYKRFKRNLNYFYQEHKGICKISILLFVLIGGFLVYRSIFITNKSYKEGQYYNVNGYSFRVNKVYYTDKDYRGNIISKKSNFVIVDLSVKNNDKPREVYLENFHIKNATEDYITTRKVYAKEFQDLGKTLDKAKELKRGEEINCIIIYKVDNKLDKNKFVLYYQENSGYLRKIKLNVEDISKITSKKLSLEDELELNLKNSDTISFDDYSFSENDAYTSRSCDSDGCQSVGNDLTITGDSRILKIIFTSEEWDAKNMIDFLTQYGKLIYKDSNDKVGTLDIVNPITKEYYGKHVFLKVPVELENAKEISIDLIVRNKQYVYKLK